MPARISSACAPPAPGADRLATLMPTHQTKRIVAHSAEQMFDLVADVEKYPRFVPLCERLKVRSRREEDGREVLLADMTVAYALFRETFTSQVTLDRAALTIVVDYIDGPFRQLHNRWHFTTTGPDSCEVDFFISWEMRSRTLAMVAGAVFERAFRTFAQAFEARAHRIYGTVPATAAT